MSLENWMNHITEAEKEELNSLDKKELDDRFYTKLQFGTAGMRGVLGVGENRMNVYQIRKIIAGYSEWLIEKYSSPSVAISYDNRRNSKVFAAEAAKIFSCYKIRVYLTSELRPTPYLSYMVRELNCNGGVMITASHNPKDNNGIKLYDNTGCQFIPSIIDGIVEKINHKDYFSKCDCPNLDLIEDCLYLDDKYIKDVMTVRLNKNLDLSKVNAVFTPLNGTTSTIIERILPHFVCVKEQMINDENFSTLILPNPEDPRVFDLAKTYADENTDILFCTDPDGDRLGCMINNHGEYVYLPGNQVAVIMLNYILESHSDLSKDDVVFKSIVTSNLGDDLCNEYGVTMRHILTGFKYVGDGISKLAKNERFLFGYEESNGGLIKDFVRDKDSLQAVLLMTEACAKYKAEGKNFIDVLDELYTKYGYYLNETISVPFAGASGKIIMKKFTDYFRNNKIEEEISKYDFLEQDEFDKSDMIIVDTNYGRLITRPSGTEAKIKVYIEIVSENNVKANAKLAEVKTYIDSIVRKMK